MRIVKKDGKKSRSFIFYSTLNNKTRFGATKEDIEKSTIELMERLKAYDIYCIR